MLLRKLLPLLPSRLRTRALRQRLRPRLRSLPPKKARSSVTKSLSSASDAASSSGQNRLSLLLEDDIPEMPGLDDVLLVRAEEQADVAFFRKIQVYRGIVDVG